MVTPTMQMKERIEEFTRELDDKNFLEQTRRCYAHYMKYSKQKRTRVPYRFRKTKLMTFPKLYKFTSKRMNRWLFIFRAVKNGAVMRMVCKYETRNGFIACEFKEVPCGEGEKMYFFVEHTTHFFRRYFERHRLHEACLKDQVEYFFLNNHALHLVPYNDQDLTQKKEPVIQYYTDGIGLGSLFANKLLIRMNTYLPYSFTEKGTAQQRRLTQRFDEYIANLDLDMLDPQEGRFNREYQKMMQAALERRGKQRQSG